MGPIGRLTNVLDSGDNWVFDQIMNGPIPCTDINDVMMWLKLIM